MISEVDLWEEVASGVLGVLSERLFILSWAHWSWCVVVTSGEGWALSVKSEVHWGKRVEWGYLIMWWKWGWLFENCRSWGFLPQLCPGPNLWFTSLRQVLALTSWTDVEIASLDETTETTRAWAVGCRTSLLGKVTALNNFVLIY